MKPEWAVPTPEEEQKLKQWAAEGRQWNLISPDEAIKLIMDYFKAFTSEKMTLGYAQWLLEAARNSGQVRRLHDGVDKDDLMGWLDRHHRKAPRVEPVMTTQPELVVKPAEQLQSKTSARRGRRPFDWGSTESKLSSLYEERGPPSPDDENPKWRSLAAVVRWVQNEIDDVVGETTVKKFVSDFDATWKKAHSKSEN
jgi:hypothetical protein